MENIHRKLGHCQDQKTTKKAKFFIRELFENKVVLPKLLKFKEMNCAAATSR
jgi:hypothetical protein